MRSCRVNLPNRCYHLISRVAHRAFFLDDAYVNAARPFLDPAIANVKDPQFPLSFCFGLRPCGASPFGRAKAADMGVWSVDGLITMVE